MSKKHIRVAELFAGVGGFRLALDGYKSKKTPQFNMPSAGPFKTVWANQWEPPGTEARQFAARCYQERFADDSLVNEDIHEVLKKAKLGEIEIPDVDLVVGGFPCQDYSVAKTLSQSGGIEGKKGVLWWDIYDFLILKSPRFVLLENVDRLLKSPASQRGRDFAIMLSCFARLGYSVEWRVINSAEYGFSQRRKRVFIFAEKTNWDESLTKRLENGLFSEAFRVKNFVKFFEIGIDGDPYRITNEYPQGIAKSPFLDAGVMKDYKVLSAAYEPSYRGKKSVLGDVVVPNSEVPEEFFVNEANLEKWRYQKGNKRIVRVNKKTGFEYVYSEGSMAFPDSLDRPARTILTGEGGRTASRFKHIIETEDGRYRRLVPDELDQLQGFPKGWTDTGMSDNQRAFCMGNALVVGIPHKLGRVISKRCIK